MALKRLTINGFGQIELNNVAFRRDGRVEAQCDLDPVAFEEVPAENGMLLAVDLKNRLIKFATDASLPIAINYSAEHLYSASALGLKNFALKAGEFRPRLGYLAVGDKFTTNCVCYDDSEFNSEDALKTALESATVYGGISEKGAIKVTKTKPTVGPVLIAKKFSMPDGQFGIQFHVLAD